MNPNGRDLDADDRRIDRLLYEELGGVVAPDFASRLATAPPERLAAAAMRVDRAMATASPHRGVPWLLGFAAAGLVLLMLGAALAVGAFGGSTSPDTAATTQAWIDRFHRVMPPIPTLLRDPARRRAVAGAALPVLRRILDGEGGFSELPRGLCEFEVYAVVLGDEALQQDLAARVGAGDAAAGAVLAIARAVVGDDAVRRAALDDLAGFLPQCNELGAGLAQALAAADLSVAEAERLAPAFAEAATGQSLVRSAAIAANGPAHRIGQRIDLFGRLVDDSLFRGERLRGRIVLVCFWASWCRPSCAALERIRGIAARHADLAVVTVSCDHDPAALHGYLADHDDATWIRFFDRLRPGWHELARSIGVHLLPTVMLLDRDGILRDLPLVDELDDAVGRLLRR